jgi:uncharacterized RDD family membrane protein YckC
MSGQNPYAPPEASVEVPAAEGEPRLAGRGARLVAVIIDAIIAAIVEFAPLYALGYARLVGQKLQWSATSASMAITAFGISFALFVLVQGYPLATAGQTWGKRALGLRIVDMNGGKPPLARLVLLRFGLVRAVRLVPVAGWLCYILDSLFIFRSDKRCVHDHIAGTRVVVAE